MKTPYLRSVMLRNLLTLLAVLAGLGAQAMPAQASAVGQSDVRVERALVQAASADAAAGQIAIAERKLTAASRETRNFRWLVSNDVAVPTVFVGVDRALE